MSLRSNWTDRKNPWRFLARKSPGLILWVVLIFSFRFDVYSEDFRFIPYESVLIMAAIAGLNIWTAIDQFHLKRDAKNIVGFKQWKEYKKIKKKFER